LLTVEQVAQATGLKVTAARRVRSRGEDAQASSSPTPPAGSICTFETASHFGWISISVQRPPAATPATYRAAREQYFATYPGSALAVPGVGLDAWIGGFATMRVLVRDDLQFWVMTQSADSTGGSAGVLISVAKALAGRFGS